MEPAFEIIKGSLITLWDNAGVVACGGLLLAKGGEEIMKLCVGIAKGKPVLVVFDIVAEVENGTENCGGGFGRGFPRGRALTRRRFRSLFWHSEGNGKGGEVGERRTATM